MLVTPVPSAAPIKAPERPCSRSSCKNHRQPLRSHFFLTPSDEQVKFLLISEDVDGLNLLFAQDNSAYILYIVLACLALFIVLIGFDIQGFIYFWLLWKTIKKHNQNIRDIFSNIEDIDLRWVRDLIFLLAVVWLVMVTFDVLAIVGVSDNGLTWLELS